MCRPSQIRKFDLKNRETPSSRPGALRIEGEKVFRSGERLRRSTSNRPTKRVDKILFDNLTATVSPGAPETGEHAENVSRARHGPCSTPLGKGQRGDRSPPACRKTMLLQNVANSITTIIRKVVVDGAA